MIESEATAAAAVARRREISRRCCCRVSHPESRAAHRDCCCCDACGCVLVAAALTHSHAAAAAAACVCVCLPGLRRLLLLCCLTRPFTLSPYLSSLPLPLLPTRMRLLLRLASQVPGSTLRLLLQQSVCVCACCCCTDSLFHECERERMGSQSTDRQSQGKT